MDWIKLIFVAIGVIIWIASNLRDMKKPVNTPAPPPLPPSEAQGNQPSQEKKSPEDLQDFLKQIRRQMGESSADPRQLDPIAPEPPRQSAPPPPPPVPPKPKQKKKREADKAPNLSKRTAEVTSLAAEPYLNFESMGREIQPMATQAKLRSRIAKAAVDLLKKPDGVATAFILREILDPPLCKRPRTK